jgi:hypothetical protein
MNVRACFLTNKKSTTLVHKAINQKEQAEYFFIFPSWQVHKKVITRFHILLILLLYMLKINDALLGWETLVLLNSIMKFSHLSFFGEQYQIVSLIMVECFDDFHIFSVYMSDNYY